MKKSVILLLIIVVSTMMVGCEKNTTISKTEKVTTNTTKKEDTTTMKNYYEPKTEVDEVVIEDLKASFNFFWETQNHDTKSMGCGLAPDRVEVITGRVKSSASIASVGYALAAIPIGVSHEWISKEEGYKRALESLTSLEKLDRVMGFYYHFYNIYSGIKQAGSEVSIIDTAIFLNGALIVGKFFGGEVEKIANRIYEDVVWTWYYDKDAIEFYMGYDGNIGKFSGHWTQYSEQLMIFILAAGSPNYPVGRQSYTLMKGISKMASKTNDYDSFMMSGTSSLFVYQYSHAFFDSKKYVDEKGFSWYENSVNASKAAYSYAQLQASNYLTCSENSWGFSACDGPNGYNGAYGSGPSGGGHQVDGTVCLSAAPASIVFTEKESLAALKYYRNNPKLWCKYGLIDSYNLGTTKTFTNDKISIPDGGWYGSDLIGIDKGNELMMLENYYSSLIWNIYQDITYVSDGLTVLGFKKVE